MKTKILCVFFICCYFWSYCQEKPIDPKLILEKIENLERSGDSLRTFFGLIEHKNDMLETKLSSMYLARLSDMEDRIKEAFDKTDVISISATYQEVIKSIINLHNEITRINNFTDAEKVFGIDFVAHIGEIADSQLVRKLIVSEDHEDKKQNSELRNRFSKMIATILQNPVISGLLKSNPITSVAHSIINQALSFRQHSLSARSVLSSQYRVPDSYKDFKSEYSNFKQSFDSEKEAVLDQKVERRITESIKSFTISLKPYIKLFEDLSDINEKYASSLDVFMKASEQTISRVLPIEKAFYAKLNAKSRTEASDKINQFFNIGEHPPLVLLEKKLMDEQMEEVLLFSKEVDEAMLLLRNDFLKIITLEIQLAQEYIQFFSGLLDKDGTPSFDDKTTLNRKIEQFMQLERSLIIQKEKLQCLNF